MPGADHRPPDRLRVRLASPTADPGDELPFRILVLADLAGRPLPLPLGERAPQRLGDPAALLQALRPRLSLRVPGDPAIPALDIVLPWTRPEGMQADDIVQAIPELAALEHHRCSLLARGRRDDGRCAADIEAALLQRIIAARAAAVLDQPQVRALDAAWRTVSWLASGMTADSAVELHVLPATRSEIEEDLGDAADVSGSGLWRTLYADEYGQHGGRPWSVLLLADVACGSAPRDLAVLRRLAAIGSLAHTVVLADAAPSLLGLADWSGLPAVEDVAAACDGPATAAWRSWRVSEDARHAALALPPFPIRDPVTPGGRRLFAPAAAAVAMRLAACHARSRWCADAAGWGAGYEVDLPAPAAFAAVRAAETPLPAACLPTEEQAGDLAAHGLCVLCASRLRSAASFPALPTLHRGVDPLPTQLPLVLIADRVAHHLKVLSRERLGGQVDRAALERELSDWLGRHVADGRVDDPELRATRPLRGASVSVHETPGRAGWMRAELVLRPHLPGSAAEVELTLASRIDRGLR